MGQRHQIYLRLPAIKYQGDNPNNRGEVTVGIHHQWLYGRSALMLLNNFLTWVKNHEADNTGTMRDFWKTSSGEAEGALAACYSCTPATGYYHRVHTDLGDACLADPRLGDNNDGITIIDVTGEAPRYCFMSINHIEAHDGDKVPVLTPISAQEYVTAYYPKWAQGKHGRWERKDGARDSTWIWDDAPGLRDEVRGLLAGLAPYELLTIERVREIFPKMFDLPGDDSVGDEGVSEDDGDAAWDTLKEAEADGETDGHQVLKDHAAAVADEVQDVLVAAAKLRKRKAKARKAGKSVKPKASSSSSKLKPMRL